MAVARSDGALDAPAHDRQPRLRPRARGDGARVVEAARARAPTGEAAAERRDAPRPQRERGAGAGRPILAAIMSFCRGDYDGAVESISAIRAAADRCGGSVAQCDLIHLTLLEAALRGHRKNLARSLADERAERKPASRLNRWLKARAWTPESARLAA